MDREGKWLASRKLLEKQLEMHRKNRASCRVEDQYLFDELVRQVEIQLAAFAPGSPQNSNGNGRNHNESKAPDPSPAATQSNEEESPRPSGDSLKS